MRGHGFLRSNGGRGIKSAGGGAGGRIALHTQYNNEYHGVLQANGGSSTGSGILHTHTHTHTLTHTKHIHTHTYV